jgi:hypothetical protein
VITGWPTDPIAVDYSVAATRTYKVTGGNDPNGSTRPTEVQARPRTPDGGWGGWRVLQSHRDSGRVQNLRLPAPGAWQVRLRVLAWNLWEEEFSAPREVTMRSLACSAPLQGTVAGAAYTRCTVVAYNQTFIVAFNGTGPFDAVRAPVVAVYFHADNQADSLTGDQGLINIVSDQTAAWALARGYAVVMPIAPHSDPPAWGATSPLYDSYTASVVGRVIRALESSFGATRAAYWGASGGSWFIGGTYLIDGIHLAPGPVAANCGGYGPMPSRYWAWSPAKQPTIRAQIPILFNYGSEDFLAPYAQAGYQGYGALGFVTAQRVWPGAGHCAIDIDGPTIEWFEQQLS